MNKVLRAAIRTMSRHQGDMTKDYEKSRKKEKMYPYYKGRSCNTMDRILHLEGRDILLRTYSYDGKVAPLILFFHGGGSSYHAEEHMVGAGVTKSVIRAEVDGNGRVTLIG